jgi:PPOX class probable F420-dependent enzyme
MTELTPELRDLIASGPLTHVTTINADGSPQVTVVWIGLDGDDLLSGHMARYRKVRNVERDPRAALSFTAPRDSSAFLNLYAVLEARATVSEGGAWDLLNRLTKVYMGPDVEFPAPRRDGGFIIRYSIERVGGVGPWASG